MALSLPLGSTGLTGPLQGSRPPGGLPLAPSTALGAGGWLRLAGLSAGWLALRLSAGFLDLWLAFGFFLV